MPKLRAVGQILRRSNPSRSTPQGPAKEPRRHKNRAFRPHRGTQNPHRRPFEVPRWSQVPYFNLHLSFVAGRTCAVGEVIGVTWREVQCRRTVIAGVLAGVGGVDENRQWENSRGPGMGKRFREGLWGWSQTRHRRVGDPPGIDLLRRRLRHVFRGDRGIRRRGRRGLGAMRDHRPIRRRGFFGGD